MKKVLLFLLILLLAFGGYIIYDNYKSSGIPVLDTEEDVVSLSELFIYGNYLNMSGSLVNDNNMDLVLYNGDFREYKINLVNDAFNLSDTINDGINLEEIPIGTYYVFLRSKNKDQEDKDIYKYYIIDNKTNYNETTYYTFSNVGNKIVINSDNDYNTLMLTVSENTDKDIYDVVVDAGHGGMDSGAYINGDKESDYTMKLALSLQKKLEEYGVKVKLTREDGQLTSNETMPDYGPHGRAVIPHEVHAKYLFSIHMNSNSSKNVHGLEVYTPDRINYDFAKNLVNNIITDAGTVCSTNRINKSFDGIYTRTFTDSDIQISKDDAAKRERKAYDITTKANYYYMIRETGGIMTGAYVDSRNEPDVLANPYYNSNVGTEAYLLELAYLTNSNDLNNINKNLDKYTSAIARTFKDIFDNSNIEIAK